ncbi:MAG: hypothetical protein ACREBE_02955, partial [bacterium]
MTWLVWLGAALAVVAAATWYARRSSRRALLRFRSRIDRFKLASRKSVRELLLADSAIASAVRAHAAETGVSETAAWQRVDGYVHEIVPFFNVVAYYQLGYRLAKRVLN